MVTCAFCEKEIRPDQIGVWRQQLCWVQNRGRAGGANQTARPASPVAWACNSCLRYSPVNDDQISLF